MIGVLGSFRFPAERVDQARPLMQQVIAETLKEPGCHAYSYAEDVSEPGLFRVTELWSDQAALDAHFTRVHMRDWVIAREALGFFDRQIKLFPLGMGIEL